MFGLFAVIAFVLLLTGSAQAQVQSPDDGSIFRNPIATLPIDDDDDGIGSKVAGSWMGQGSFAVDLGCDGSVEFPFVPVTDAHTFGVGGSHVATNPANPNSGHGTWVKTGSRQITVRDLNFAADGLGGTATISMVVNFDRRFETATTTFAAKVYDPGVDPLDSNSSPSICTEGQHDPLRKVSATE
jgi:hypothetical protein